MRCKPRMLRFPGFTDGQIVFGAHKSRGTTLGINKYNGTPGTDVGHLEILAERRQLRQILSYAFYADQGSRPDVEH